MTPRAQSAAVRFGGLGRRYILVVFADRPAGLLSHADGSGLFPEARQKLTALSWEEIRLALMLDISSNYVARNATKSDGKIPLKDLTFLRQCDSKRSMPRKVPGFLPGFPAARSSSRALRPFVVGTLPTAVRRSPGTPH